MIKRLLVFLACVLCVMLSFSQETDPPVEYRENYYTHQKDMILKWSAIKDSIIIIISDTASADSFYVRYSDYAAALNRWIHRGDTMQSDTGLFSLETIEMSDFYDDDFIDDDFLMSLLYSIINKSDHPVKLTNTLTLEDTLYFAWSNPADLVGLIVNPNKSVDTVGLVPKAWLLWCDTLRTDSIYLLDPPFGDQAYELKYDPVTDLVYFYYSDEGGGEGTIDTFLVKYICEPSYTNYWIFSGDSILVDTCGTSMLGWWNLVNGHLEPKNDIDSVWANIIRTDTIYRDNLYMQIDSHYVDLKFKSSSTPWKFLNGSLENNWYAYIKDDAPPHDYPDVVLGDTMVIYYNDFGHIDSTSHGGGNGTIDVINYYGDSVRYQNNSNIAIADVVLDSLRIYGWHYDTTYSIAPLVLNDQVYMTDSIYVNRYAIPHLKPTEPVGLPLVMRKLNATSIGQLAQTSWQKFKDTLDYNTEFNYDISFEFRDLIAGTAQTYTLDIKASWDYVIDGVCLETDNGTLTGVHIDINSTPVTGLSSLTVDTGVDETNATAANTVTTGDRIYIKTSTGYTGSPTLIRGKLKATR